MWAIVFYGHGQLSTAWTIWIYSIMTHKNKDYMFIMNSHNTDGEFNQYLEPMIHVVRQILNCTSKSRISGVGGTQRRIYEVSAVMTAHSGP